MREATAGAREVASPSAQEYRPDIDGLRAIAVASVVVFHAGIGGMPGGFTGVDIFFVISGYLIGGQIFRDARSGRFSYLAFYGRRARRILPALFCVLAVFLAVGFAVMTPLELRELGRETVPTVVGASNILYYLGGGYFAPAADYNPLLMTWSLGVEEQFYIAFPVLAFLLLRFGVRPLPVLLGLSAALCLASLFLTRLDQNAAFYLLPTRAWELGIGVVLALWKSSVSRRVEEAASVIGLSLIVAGLLLYRGDIAFPGWFALLPVAGAVLLVAAPRSTINRVLLSSPPMTFVGRISYSWYLWHWPLFYVVRILDGFGSVPPAALLAASLGLAWLSWRFVEQPFRRHVPGIRTLLFGYGTVAAAIAAVGLAAYLSNGWPGRLSAEAERFTEAARRTRTNPCLAPYGAVSPVLSPACLPHDPRARLVVLGDSHASSIAPGFRRLAEREGLAFGQMTKSSCPPIAGAAAEMPARPRHRAECIAYQTSVFRYLEEHPEIRIVVLAGYWASSPELRSEAGASEALPVALAATIARLEAMGRKVIVVQDVPLLPVDPYARAVGDSIALRAALSAWLNPDRGDGASTLRSDLLPDPSRPSVQALASGRPDTRLLDPHDELCRQDRCRYREGSHLYYADFQHLTAEGALAAVGETRLPPGWLP